jgi:hypothetical protein
MTKPKIICLTPVKNESWILDRFLKCTSLWADHIIICDQQSEDGSKDIALSYPKVTLLENSSEKFNEPTFRQMLIDTARKITGPRLLICLDADEFLTSNFINSPEWNTLVNSSPGTLFRFQWVNIHPNMNSYWLGYKGGIFAFMDDGVSKYVTRSIHGPRLPEPMQSKAISLNDIKILHYSHTNSERARSKQRWYQCWEMLHSQGFRPVSAYRKYHEEQKISQQEIYSIRREWLNYYEQEKIDMTSIIDQNFYAYPKWEWSLGKDYGEITMNDLYWWDREILNWMSKYGSNKFKRLDIWNDIDWQKLAHHLMPHYETKMFIDPRTWIDKVVFAWLSSTQKIHQRLLIRVIDKALVLLNW